jgi:copper chaperone CopZ
VPSDTPSPAPAPHDFVDAEFSIAGMKTPSDEQALSSALSGLDGIVNLRISSGLVAVEYDPLLVTKVKLCEAITGAGYRVEEVESGLASPISDALHEENHIELPMDYTWPEREGGARGGT